MHTVETQQEIPSQEDPVVLQDSHIVNVSNKNDNATAVSISA